MNIAGLSELFPPETIHWRIGSVTKDKSKGMALSYLNARDVMDRLDAVLSPLGWRDSYAFVDKRILCTIEVWDEDAEHWVAKTDGAGETDIESEKGGLSDAFKRCAVKWGVGRYLYALESPWVDIESFGPKSHRIKRGQEAKLIAILGGETEAKGKPPAKKKAARKKAAAKKDDSVEERASHFEDGAEDASGEVDERTLPAGVLILKKMRERCVQLGISDEHAGKIVAQIIVGDMKLDKDLPTLEANLDEIVDQISRWEAAA